MTKIYNSVLEEIQDFLDSYKAVNFTVRSRSKSLLSGEPIMEPPNKNLEKDASFNIRAGGKYSGKLNASGDGMVQLDSFTVRLPPSSTIQTATYWPQDVYLTVSFKSGHTYEYNEVPMKVIKAWMLASSAGSFFYYNIRTSFQYHKV